MYIFANICSYMQINKGNVSWTYLLNVSVIQDPCNIYRSVNDTEKRSTGFYVDWTVDDPISDEILEEDWYRFFSNNGDDMPTSPPGIKNCGTINPLWLNGTFFAIIWYFALVDKPVFVAFGILLGLLSTIFSEKVHCYCSNNLL